MAILSRSYFFVHSGNHSHQLEARSTRWCGKYLKRFTRAPKGENYNQFQPSLSIKQLTWTVHGGRDRNKSLCSREDKATHERKGGIN